MRFGRDSYYESEWDLEDLFRNCTSLASYRVSASLGGVSAYMFSDCTSLASEEIPEGVGRVGESAFYGCPAPHGSSNCARLLFYASL